MNMRPRILAMSSGALLCGALIATGSPAAAAEDPADAVQGDACWLEVDTGRNLCADSASALASEVAMETGTVFALSSTQSGATPRELMVDARDIERRVEPRLTYLLTYIYDGKSYSGKLKILTTSQSTQPCQLAQNYVYGQWTSLWFTAFIDPWENRIRSFKTFNSCRLKLYDAPGFTGATFGPSSGAPSLGILDKRARSMRIVK